MPGASVRRLEDRAAIVIPARFGSSRFPGKPLVALRGARGEAKSLIRRSWEAARLVSHVSDIVIATDDVRIEAEATSFSGTTILTSTGCRNGTERCWEAVQRGDLGAELIINLQGDAPLTPPLAVEAVIEALLEDRKAQVASAMIKCSPVLLARLLADQRRGSVGGTTVVFDQDRDALYFSKRVIPFVPERCIDAPVYLHLGLYGYRREALARYAALPPSVLEENEGLEQLRFLHAGIKIRMVEIPEPPGGLWEINNPADVVPVEAGLVERGLH